MNETEQDGLSRLGDGAGDRLLRHLLHAAHDGIVVAGPDDVVQIFNPAAERLFGRPASGVIGSLPLDRLFPPGAWTHLRRHLSRASGGPIEAEALDASGDRVPIDLSLQPLAGAGMAWIVCGLHDRRPRAALEERLARAETQLRMGLRPAMLSELAAAVAHELNQPLTAIYGNAELVRRKMVEGTPEAARLDSLLAEADRMAEAIRRIGSVTRYATKPYVGQSRIMDLDRPGDTGPRDPPDGEEP